MKNPDLTIHLASENETLQFGARLAAAAGTRAVLFLYGPLGAGKTTLTRGFLRGLGCQEKIKSPTYTLVEAYDLPDRTVFHFDFYRLNDPQELEHIGIQEYFQDTAVCLVEWPEKGLSYLPEPDLACYLMLQEQGRDIRVEARSALGEKILQDLKK